MGILALALIVVGAFIPYARHLDRVDRLNSTTKLGS